MGSTKRYSHLQMADAADSVEHNYDSMEGVAKLSSSERYKTVMEVLLDASLHMESLYLSSLLTTVKELSTAGQPEQ